MLVVCIMTIAMDCYAASTTSPEFKVESSDLFILADTIPLKPLEGGEITLERNFHEGLLDYFCKLYFKKEFGDDYKYIEGSIVIEKVILVDNGNGNKVQINGVYDYNKKPLLITRHNEGKDFKATVKKTGEKEYQVIFEKYTWYGEWVPSKAHTITYP